MKSFLIACVAAVIIAVIGGVVMSNSNESVEKAYSLPSSTRVG